MYFIVAIIISTRLQDDKISQNFDELSCLQQPELYRLCTVDCDVANYDSSFGMCFLCCAI